METITYTTKGTCSKLITIEIDGDTVKSVAFTGGCMGNTQGVARLCAGRKIADVVSILEGVDCNGRGTSCPDQLAKALKPYVK